MENTQVVSCIYYILNTLYIYIYRVSKKKCDLRAWCKSVTFLCNSSVWCFLNIFWKFVFFGTSMANKRNSRTFFSFKIKSSEKQKCVNKLFLSKSKILKRLNHRISENLQNCNWKICNFQFWCNFQGKIVFQWC